VKELKALREVYRAGTALRQTAPVDDDFPRMMHSFDCALMAASKVTTSDEGLTINGTAKAQCEWVERMGWHNKTVLEALALIGSEVGEAVNECRMGKPSEKFGEELADIILRTLDLSVTTGVNIEQAIIDKMALNETRGTRGRVV
jgi:NTP pyrophosphatase (non-canonical NTP hydrolase)|tara:strand:+ start:5403 stop:5837 length:435 start_codon:yes stop_codon:yes gene_type:complete